MKKFPKMMVPKTMVLQKKTKLEEYYLFQLLYHYSLKEVISSATKSKIQISLTYSVTYYFSYISGTGSNGSSTNLISSFTLDYSGFSPSKLNSFGISAT